MIDTGLPTFAELLSEIDYPATRDDLVRLAKRGHAERGTVARLQVLPNRSFNGAWDVRYALEGHGHLAEVSAV
jgi:hypothetical protein